MKKPIKRFVVIFQLLVLVTLFFSTCKKDDSNDPDPIAPSGPTLKTTVTGKVTDINGNILSGVLVDLGDITTVTDNRGYFLFVDTDVPKERCVLVASKSGYFNCVSGKKTQDGDANYINLVMQQLPAVVNIPGTSGGVVNIAGGATITFPVDAFVDQNGTAYTGQVKVYARHISPAADNFEAIVPGGDLLGINTLGDEQSLYSLGMIETKLYDNTGLNEVKLATGKTAALKFPIHASQTSVALSTIPMWHLDEETATWEEEGLGTKSGNFYIANVSHFSTWNCDYPGERTDIEGKVVDCQNNVMANIVVTINGFMNVTTDNTGSFSTWVPVGYLIQCQVLQSNNPFIAANSPIQSVTAVAGQINVIPTLAVPCATRISGTVKNCDGTTSSPGFIYATWNGGTYMQYTDNGSYQIYVLENTAVNIHASTSSAGGSTSAISGAQGTTISAPEILLCNAITIGQNKFTINNNGGGSTTYSLTNIVSQTNFIDVQNNGSAYEQFAVSMQATANPGNYPCYVSIVLADQTDGYFSVQGSPSINSVHIEMDSLWTYASGSPLNTTGNKVIFTDFGCPGGVTSGTFEFDCATGSVTGGEFSVIRNN